MSSQPATPPEGSIDCSEEETKIEESESGKLKQLLGVLKKAIGVKDLASLRLSLPSHLMSPKGNLEYWQYLDRPDLFVAITDSDDELERLLAVIRWAFSKELHFVHEKLCKPYNSVLGEQFRAIWDVTPAHPSRFQVYQNHADLSTSASSGDATPTFTTADRKANLSVEDGLSKLKIGNKSNTSVKTASSSSRNELVPVPSSPTSRKAMSIKSSRSIVSLAEEAATPKEPVRVAFLNEQVCHHPPVSNFWLESTGGDGKGRVQACGVDQLSARFNGTSVKVYTGSQNNGIFVTLPDRDGEEYHLTHPTAAITGFFSRQIFLTIADYAVISVSKGKRKRNLQCLINYLDESWIGKAKFAIEGVIYESDGSEEFTKLKQVPESSIVARLSGSWRGSIYLRRKGESKDELLVDLQKLEVVPKRVRIEEDQGPMETRRFWKDVTEPLLAKDFARATKQKQAIEQMQRNKAAEMAKNEEEHIPVFFEANVIDGRPELSEAGRKALQEELDAVNYQ